MRFLLSLLLLIAAPAQARWFVADTAHFRVHSDGPERELRTAAALLEDYWALLLLLTGTKEEAPGPKLDVYLVRGVDQLREVRRVPSSVAGVYVIGPTDVAAFATRSFDATMGRSDVLQHEIAHHFMFRHAPVAYPAWYVEGFAEYMMTADIRPERIEFGTFNPNRAAWLVNVPWISAKELLTRPPREFRGERGAMFYAQSWLVVHYLFRNPEKRKALQAYLAAVASGRSDDEAFLAAFGTDYRGFERELRSYLTSRRMTRSVIKRAAAPPSHGIEIRALPPTADDLLLADANLRLGVGDAWRAARLAQVRREAARHPGDAFATRVLAHAEVTLGDRAKGRALLDGLIAADAANAELLYLRGLADLLDGRPEPARRLLTRAHKLDPLHAATLFHYGRSFMGAGVPSENTVNIALLAADLAPQVPAIAAQAATALMARQRFDEAIPYLTPIAYNPHGGAEAEMARILIEAAKARQAPPVLSVSFGTEQDGERSPAPLPPAAVGR